MTLQGSVSGACQAADHDSAQEPGQDRRRPAPDAPQAETDCDSCQAARPLRRQRRSSCSAGGEAALLTAERGSGVIAHALQAAAAAVAHSVTDSSSPTVVVATRTKAGLRPTAPSWQVPAMADQAASVGVGRKRRYTQASRSGCSDRPYHHLIRRDRGSGAALVAAGDRLTLTSTALTLTLSRDSRQSHTDGCAARERAIKAA